ncbi:Gfo/Idh/MocA family protein [Ensifer soli]|uniref:Gfo/Idh/MocA family protein n=1 Tax=Ciceribacter sp. sgz301302 TaxID=3342379 RepID=UPI0035B70B0E
MLRKDDRRLRVGVLGCGPIAQFAHLESCVKARNADLYAICDAAPDLLARMGATYEPEKQYGDYDAMLADPELEAVIVATSDAYHVPMTIKALDAGKHVLCEKPVGVSIEEGMALAEAVKRSGKVYQVGHMKRFDPALEAARDFVRDEIGTVLALKAWYCDSTHRYTNTDAVQPLPVTSRLAKKPAGNPKADLRQYFMLAHGSHLVDTARFFCGEITAVRARLNEQFGAYCWFVETEFASGALGHLDLTVAVRMDWHEGFQLYGENGSVIAKTFNPWYFRASEVDIFREKDATARRPLGADGHFFRRQLEGFADTILDGKPMRGATVDDGVASIRAMVAIARSVESGARVSLTDVTGAV